MLAADTSIDEPVEVLADSAYGSGEMLTAIQAAGHRAIIKPMPISRAVRDGFTVDDFDVDHDGRTITCPAGVVRSIGAKGQVAFGVVCSTCPLRERCTTSVSGRKMKIRAHDQIKREHRVRAKDPDFQAVYRQHRPNGRKNDRVDDPRSPPRSLSRCGQEQRLVEHPNSWNQPQTTPQSRIGPRKRVLGHRISLGGHAATGVSPPKGHPMRSRAP